MDSDFLFYGRSLDDVLRAHGEKMKSVVSDVSAERFNGATDDEIVARFVSEYEIMPLTIHDDRAEAEHRETRIDVSQDPLHRFIHDDSGPVMAKADAVTLIVPFSGDPQLFKLTPSRRSLNPPRGRVIGKGETGGTVSMGMALPSDVSEAGRFNAWMQEQLKSLGDFAGWVNADVTQFNQQLPQQVREAVQTRRQRLEKQGNLLQKLSIPLRTRNGAPSPTPIPMPRKVVKPLPPARKVEQEYGIGDDQYEYILKIIRHESRSFESTPATFAKLDEEELRDIVLAHLNGHFEGGAAGERFRKKGKTDICIEHENRAAFVTECKLWKGRKALHDAIDKLLGYLTWRDTRAALISWNINNKDFARLQTEMPEHLNSHRNFVRLADAGHAGEWRAVFRSDADEGREIVVHVFLVDLYVAPRNADA